MNEPYYLPPSSESYRPTVIEPIPTWEAQLRPQVPFLPVTEEREFTARKIFLHLLLLGLTILTTTGIGALLFWNFSAGLLFSFTLLGILGSHEMGHYLAARWYGVSVTLPYFIPAPIGIGTFGAFIKIKSPIPDKKALFDIGIAGPFAGFVFAIPAAIVALYFAQSVPNEALTEGVIIFNDPLLFRLLQRVLGLSSNLNLNPVYLAAWVGMLVTSLNLLPVGQLDGGHVVYAVFGGRVHWLTARVVWLIVVALAVHALVNGAWAGWVIYALLLTLMLRAGHPPLIYPDEPLGFERKIVAFIGLMVFLLCFNPFPITFI